MQQSKEYRCFYNGNLRGKFSSLNPKQAANKGISFYY